MNIGPEPLTQLIPVSYLPGHWLHTRSANLLRLNHWPLHDADGAKSSALVPPLPYPSAQQPRLATVRCGGGRPPGGRPHHSEQAAMPLLTPWCRRQTMQGCSHRAFREGQGSRSPCYRRTASQESTRASQPESQEEWRPSPTENTSRPHLSHVVETLTSLRAGYGSREQERCWLRALLGARLQRPWPGRRPSAHGCRAE